MDRAGTYALLDCGDGRRLDDFGGLVVDRPAPSADRRRRTPGRWAGAISYRAGAGWSLPDGEAPEPVASIVEIDNLTMAVAPTPGGQVGLFPEHAANASWLDAAVRSAAGSSAKRPNVLNLFAHTGYATLLAARAGAEVVHVDASRPAVAWARRNADLNGLADRPIRWIVDDVQAFLAREARRGRRYGGIIVDPPSYGHGRRGAGRAAGSTWSLDDDIGELLDACAAAAEPDAFWLLTAHTPGWTPTRLSAALDVAVPGARGMIEGIDLAIHALSGAVLPLGAAARFDPHRPHRR